MSDSESRRIDELESRLAFLDDTVEQLDSVIARQDHDIRVMQQRLSELVTKLDDLGDSVAEEGGSHHEIPPHY